MNNSYEFLKAIDTERLENFLKNFDPFRNIIARELIRRIED